MHSLRALRDIALEHAQGEHPDLASLARELGSVVHRDAAGLAVRLARLHQHGKRRERWLLAACRRPLLRVSIRAWPAGEYTPLRDQTGGWSLQLTLCGALELQTYRRDPHSGELEALNRSWLGPGDASWFERDAGLAHRCRNLSRFDTAYTFNIHSGALPDDDIRQARDTVRDWLLAPRDEPAIAGLPA